MSLSLSGIESLCDIQHRKLISFTDNKNSVKTISMDKYGKYIITCLTHHQDYLYICEVMVTNKINVAANSFDHFGMPFRWDKKT